MPRYNKSANPSAINNITGWSGSSPTRITGLTGVPRSTGGRISMGSGAFSASLNGDFVTAASGQTWSYVCWLRSSVSRTIRSDLSRWNSGTFVGPSVSTDTALSANVWTQVRDVITLPSGTFNQINVNLDLPTSGSAGNLDMSSVRIEQVNDASLTYADGASGAGWGWDGTAGSSRSTQSDVQQITATGITSALSFGTAAVLGTTTLSLSGIASGEAFGTLALEQGKVRVGGIASAEAFGTAALSPGPVALAPIGITSALAFGAAKLRTSLNLAGQLGAVRRQVTYDLVMVARIPSATGAPTLMEVDPIVWSGLSWTDELSKPQRLDVSAAMATLPDSVLRRCERAREQPSELWLYRGGRLVFAGPLMSGQRQGETVTLYALGLLGYARYWWVESDLVYSSVDQFTIANGLVDHWQSLEYGDYGIDTSQVGTCGITRDATYLVKEGHNIGQRLEELGKRENGFDIAVDPITRALQLSYPIQGIDRSVGEDAIVFDGSNITNANVTWSTAPDDVASEAYGVGTGGDAAIRSVRSNTDLRAQFGRCGATASFDGVSEQGTLDDHTQGLLDARNDVLLIPGPDVRVTPDVDPATYMVGDTVAYVLADRLGVAGSFRLRKRTIRVSSTGRELASFEFA